MTGIPLMHRPTHPKKHRAEWFEGLAGTRRLLACLAGAGVAAGVLFGQDASESTKAPPPKKPMTATAAPSEAVVASARERAKLLHDVYTTTLEVMHRHYFRREGAVLPARAMDDVFEEMAGRSGGHANWIAVNTKAMSLDHEPTTTFEKKAAAELAAGKEEYELVTQRVYRRATVIPLHSSCVGCHTKMFSDPPKSPRFAGLVISIPLTVEKK
jgi:hypothetical protein